MRSYPFSVSLMLTGTILLMSPMLCASHPRAQKHHRNHDIQRRAGFLGEVPTATSTHVDLTEEHSAFIRGTATPRTGPNCAEPPSAAFITTVTCPVDNGTAYSASLSRDNYTV